MILWLAALAVCRPTDAQILQRSVAVQGVRILTMDGAAIEHGTVVITGSKIRAVGADVKLPLLAKTIEAEGTTITPGLIDAGSLLGRGRAPATGQGNPAARAEDAFDRYDTVSIVGALRQGVTAVYLSPQGAAGVCGTGAVMRLTGESEVPGVYGSVLKSEAALCIDLSSSSPSVTRLKTLQAVRKAIQAAIEYREQLDNYEEDLAEYTRQLAEQSKKKLADKKKPDAEKPDRERTGRDGAGRDGTGPRLADEEEAEKKPPAKEPAAKPGEPAKPKRPRRPTRSLRSELMLRALQREMPVRVIAHRSSDILNALHLAEEFSLDLVLDGATEAHLVAEEIAAAKATVVLGPLDLPGLRRNDVYRRAARDPGRLLEDADIPWIVGSGAGNADRSRFILFQAELATAYETSRDPLRLITADAAQVLGVSQQIGRLRRGMFADFVVWSGDPLDPATKVLRVFVGGQQVYPLAE